MNFFLQYFCLFEIYKYVCKKKYMKNLFKKQRIVQDVQVQDVQVQDVQVEVDVEVKNI